MYATITYIDRNTRWDDVEFYVSQKYSNSSEIWSYVKHVCKSAEKNSVRLLDITVFDGEKEIWNWKA